jgi:hypothetical protein
MSENRNQDVAVVGSPSTNTELTLDLLQEATEERLVGALSAFRCVQNGSAITSVGQIVGIELKNRWHEDSVFRNLIKRTGEIPPITNRQDTRTADLVVGATFRQNQDGYDPEVLGMVPPTGTRVFRVDQPLLDDLLKVYQSEIVYLGRAYANDVMFPMWFKHFGSGDGGAGEAYHMGVFGKTGSGKSGLAKMMMCAYGRHPQMGILVIDPQGEFSHELAEGRRIGQQGLPLDEILKAQGRQIHVYRISDIQLVDWTSFEELLHSLRFLEQLGIPLASAANSRKAAEVIIQSLDGAETLSALGTERILQAVMNTVASTQNAEYIYSKARAGQLTQQIQRILGDARRMEIIFKNYWSPICELFTSGAARRKLYNYGSQTSPGIIDALLGTAGSSSPRPVIVVDLSREGNQQAFWSEELQRRLLSKILNTLVVHAMGSLSSGKSANVLVVLDEAHRHAPSGRLDEDSEAEKLRSTLRRAVRETRKYGLGWFFISQTLGGLDNEILQQLRILAFGFGLAMGSEFDRLRDYVGGDKRALELYQSFRDPQSFPRRDLQEFPFMAVGPVSPLAFSGKPLFFTAFTDSSEFKRVNNFR